MAAGNGNEGFFSNLPILDGKNYDHWVIRMEAILGYQELWEVVTEGAKEKDEAANKKKDCKARRLLHQCVDPVNFEKIAKAKTAKEGWEILQRAHGGAEKIKKVRLQCIRRKFELAEMEDSEKVADYFNRLQLLANQIKSCGEAITEISVVEKVLRTLSDKFDNVVTTIEECGRDLKTLSIEELQATLEAHEMKRSVRSSEKKGEEQTLKAQISKNRGSGRGKWKSNRGGGKFGRGAHSSVQESGYGEKSE
ncbi:uncharacterized protein LOC114195081 [Vigna unguiculata]|uniref:uncharacterized protein LOC114195081 n=1 Tax=Vigna unguiculata TaxID=3917 RepID=UPI001015F542|nr:uncharacterized protein LOC114195081 [Vigna unguiculata]